jgi:type I restriction enzyme S subunit
MKLETFFEKFDQFAEAPNAVAKMRELVLGLAVRGKLVEQDPSDEPASELLKQIYAAKSDRRFCAESGEDPTASSDCHPFVIPNSWQWVGATAPAKIISEVGKKIQTKDVLPEGTYPVVDQGKVFIRGYCNDSEKVINVTQPIVLFGDHTRETKFIDFDFVVGADGVKLLQPLCIDPRYYFLALRWLPLDSRGYSRHFKLLRASYIPLPPLAEQKRIVAKVDELMALCDRLETQQQERDTRRTLLARASIARFADAPTPANLNLLFHPSYANAPADLRKTILTLAVQGKIVPQDIDDVPANQLIARLENDRERIAKEQGLRLPKNVPTIDTDNIPHDIPESWQWERIGRLAVLIDYGTSQKADSNSSNVPVYRMGNIVCGKLIDENLKYVEPTIKDLPCLYLKTDDILFNRTNSYELVGKTGIFNGPNDTSTFASYLIRIRLPKALLYPSFFNLAMNAPYFRETQIEPEITQQCGQANFNGTKLASTLVPVPPLAEQRRIVAKVDQLMALVDQLGTQLTASRAAATNLMEAVVAELTIQE